MLTTFTVQTHRERLVATLLVDLTKDEAHLTLIYAGRISSQGTFRADNVNTPHKAESWFRDALPIVAEDGRNMGFEPRIDHFMRLAKIEDDMGVFLPADEQVAA